jgi:FkbM family methyltransferase
MIKNIIKKNYHAYIFFYFLYDIFFVKVKEVIFFSSRLIVSYLKKNNTYKNDGKISLFNREFFFPENFFEHQVGLKRELDNPYKSTLMKEYNLYKEKFFQNNIEIILDIGGSIGYQSIFYKEIFNDQTVIHSFEPNKDSYFFLYKNTANIVNLTTYNFALGNENKKDFISIPFNNLYRKNNPGIYSMVPKANFSKKEILVKKFDSLNLLPQKFNSIYCKIDTEGYEKEVCMGMINLLKQNKNIYLKLEFNKNFNNLKKIKNKINFFENLNFKFFINQNEQIINCTKKEIIAFCYRKNVEVLLKKVRV